MGAPVRREPAEKGWGEEAGQGEPMAGTRHMLMRSAVLILALFLRASAQDRYLIRIQGDVNLFAQNHGLAALTQPDNSANPVIGSIRPLQRPVPGLYVATLASGGAAQAVLQSIQNDPAVLKLEADQKVGLFKGTAASSSHWHLEDSTAASGAGSTTYFGTTVWNAYVNQPAAGIVRIANAHQIATGAGTVAFLDTGADFLNPVLSPVLNFGWDFTTNSPGGFENPAELNQSTTSILDSESIVVLDQSTTSILDQSTTSILDGQPATSDYGHGTMVAGIIHLVAPTASLLPVKVFRNDGTSDLSTILSGLYWAVDNGAKVINMSFSMSGPSDELAAAIAYANSQRVICVASAGNDGGDVTVYPAGYGQVIGVGSTNNSDVRSSFSNYGSVVSVAAPGEGVITTYPGFQYAAGWGTSFSAPFVSGAAALLVSIRANISESHALEAISQAVPVGQGLGAGRLDLYQACSYQAAKTGN